MKKINLLAIAIVLLTTVGCIERGPVYRPVDFVPDSLIHDDVPSADEETQEMLQELEDEPIITVPDIPQESDLLNDNNRIDIDQVMREGF